MEHSATWELIKTVSQSIYYQSTETHSILILISCVLPNAVVKTVRVQINVIRFIVIELADV